MNALLRALHWLEDALLTLLLGLLVAFAAYQVIARNLGAGGLLWGDALVRVLVFWITMAGAMVAARRDEHIRFDALFRFLPAGLQQVALRGASLFAAIVCGALAWYSLQFVRYEYEDGVIAFGSVPAWLCESILPIGAFVLALRYVLRVFKPQ